MYLKEQKERARNARKDEESMGGQNEEFLNFKAESRFSGYNTTNQKICNIIFQNLLEIVRVFSTFFH